MRLYWLVILLISCAPDGELVEDQDSYRIVGQDQVAPKVIKLLPDFDQIKVVMSHPIERSSVKVSTTGVCEGNIQLSRDGFNTCLPFKEQIEFLDSDHDIVVKLKNSLKKSTKYFFRLMPSVMGLGSKEVKEEYK